MSDKITAQARANLFAMATRQNMQMLAKQTVTSTPNTVQFTLPKARLLAGLYVRIKATFPEGCLDGTTGSPMEVKSTKFHKLVRRISLDLNNGFAPFVVSGRECAFYNMIDVNADNVINSWVQNVSNQTVTFNYHLPVTTNKRDPIGLILLQNDQTNVTLSIDLGLASEFGAPAEPTKVEVSVMAETFSIPANANAYPDLSVLKLVNGRKDSLPTEGQQVIKLATGTIYRKLAFYLTDEEGNPMKPEDITSNIELVFNQADINYSISAEMFRELNAKDFGCYLPEGLYVFDFSAGGSFSNMGGTRDFIDSANLTEFWLRFNTTKKGKCEIVTETLARLS